MAWYQYTSHYDMATTQCMSHYRMVPMHVTLYHMSCNGITGPKLMFAVPGHLPEAVHFLCDCINHIPYSKPPYHMAGHFPNASYSILATPQTTVNQLIK